MTDRPHVVVLGAGIAGAAAAWAAATRARVTIVDGGAGASSFTSGAIDLAPWEERLEPTEGLPPLVEAFVHALGAWDVASSASTSLATVAGRVRTAMGRDRGLLDLTRARDRRVLVPRADRPGWDADALSRTWNEEAPPELGVRFEAVDADVLRYEEETRVSDAELATRHDAPARIAWLTERLRRVLAKNGERVAVMLGPWLGANASASDALSTALKVPVGEALSGTAGTAGLRFEAARDRLLEGRVTTLRGRATAIRALANGASHGFRVEVDDSFAGATVEAERAVQADAVVIATGGLIGGGIVYAPPSRDAGADGPPKGHAAFRLSFDVDDRILGGHGFKLGGSIHGPVLDETAWPRAGREGVLEAVGLSHHEGALAPGVRLAGDVRKGAHRTVLEAVRSGLAAGATLVTRLSEGAPEVGDSLLRA